MKFPYDVPNIDIFVDGKLFYEIKSVQFVLEYEDKIVLQCAEYIDVFKKGFVCDFVFKYLTRHRDDLNIEEHSEAKKDLVLVHINKKWSMDGLPEFKYIFYK